MPDFKSVATAYLALAREMDSTEAKMTEIEKGLREAYEHLASAGIAVPRSEFGVAANLGKPVNEVDPTQTKWKYRFVGPLGQGPQISDVELATLHGAGSEVEAPFDVDTIFFDVERYEVDSNLLRVIGRWGHHRLTKEARIPGEIMLPLSDADAKGAPRGRLDRLIFRSSRFFT